MTHQDPELRMYAENGFRSAADWASLGRVVRAGLSPRVTAAHRRGSLVLFSRDQTDAKPKNQRGADRAAVAPAAEAAALGAKP